MFEGLRQKIGLAYTRYHFRSDRGRVTQFTEAVSRAKRALVIYPEASVDWETSQLLLKQFSRRYAPGSVMVILREEFLPTLPATPGVRTITYRPDDVSGWFLPRDPLIRRMKTTTFDVVFDLNIAFTLTSAFLCRASESPLRVSFAKPHGDEFYNLQIQTKVASNTSAAYKSFLRCLEMF